MVAVAFALYFLLLLILELMSALKPALASLNIQVLSEILPSIPEGGSLINAFVLATITATYVKGAVTGRVAYPIVASLIASAFSVLMFLAFLASGDFSFAIFGILALPYNVKKVRERGKH